MTTLIPKFEQPFTGAVNLPINQKLQQTLNILDFGADPTGATDSTAAIQNAITAAGIGGTINFPTGTFLVSATLNGLVNQQFIGAGVNNTIIRRFGNYGDTLHFTNAGAALITGFWFWHGDLPAVGFTSLDYLATSGAHINFGNAQSAIIEECWMWRLPFGINIQQGSIIKINKCNIQGCWNTFATSAAQEGVSCIYIGSTAYTQLVEITNCYLGGSNAGPQTVTITTTDKGAQSYTIPGANAGSQQGIRVNTCEGLLIDSCYIGGNSYNNIFLNPNAILSQVRITNNFFDGASYQSPGILIQPQSDGQYAIMVNISNNCFNVEIFGYQAIGSYNPYGIQPTFTDFNIAGNIISNTLGSGIFLRHIQGGVISDNTITAYNTGNLTAGGDPSYSCGIYVDNSSGTYISNNLVGGAINSSNPSGSYCYQGIIISGTNNEVDAKNNYFNGVGTSALNVGRVDKATVIKTANYTMTGAEDLVIITNQGSTSIQVTPPSNVPPGYTFTIKDGNGTAGTYPIQLVATADNVLNPVYSTNYVTKTFTWNGTQWNVTGN